MKRTLAITVMCMLLCATVGATAAVAKVNQPAGKSSVYQYTVNIDPAGTGKLVVNMKQQTFTFTGKGCQPGTYSLYYTSSAGRVDLGTPTDADVYGNVAISGKCTATADELKTVKVEATAPPEPIKASFTVDFTEFTDTSGLAAWWVDPTGSTGPITKYELTYKYEGRILWPGPQEQTIVLTKPQQIGTDSGFGPVEMTLTVYDAAGNKDSTTQTVTAPVQIKIQTPSNPYGSYASSGTTVYLEAKGMVATFVAPESGTWRILSPEYPPTNEVWIPDASLVTAISTYAPVYVSFYKQGSDLTGTPDWVAKILVEAGP